MRSLAKIAIVGFHNLHLMQFLYKYTDILDKNNIDYDVLYWNRDGIEYDKKIKGGMIGFKYLTDNYVSKWKKINGYLKAQKFFSQTIKKNKYEKIILLTTQTAIALSWLSLTRYKNMYIYDYRDITMERNPVYKKIVNTLIKNAAFVAISSKGFIPIIGYNNDNKYVISHNCSNLLYNHHKKSNKFPIKIVFWGMVRQIEYQKKICDFFGNDERFKIFYHGEGMTDILKKYCDDKEYENIFFSGRYFTEEISGFAKNTDILLNLYENDKKQEYALTVKLYDGLRYGLPMMVTKDSYMDSYIGKEKFKYSFSFDKLDELIEWYMDLSDNEIEISEQRMIRKILKDEKKFTERLLEFCR